MAAEFISRKPIDYIIRGAIGKEGPRFKVSVELIDKATGVQLWGTSRSHVINGPELLAFEEETARVIAANIASERGIIALNLSKETRAKPPSKYTSYDAMLKFYEFESVLSDKVYLDALKALETAAPVEADCDQLCSMLGRLHAINYSHEFFPQPDSLVKAFRYAEKGVALNPENQRARTILAFCMMLSNEITPALKELQKALELNPQSLLFNDSIGYVMALCGEFERGVELILSNMRLNPYYNPTVHYALYCNWIRTGQYEQAYLETHHMRRRLHFWDPLLRAAILGLLGKVDEGKVAANELLRLKPNFQERSMVLMKHYLKFDEILDPILSGLRNVGLKID
jgi:tetratricopeptide (TPR) repeat protein